MEKKSDGLKKLRKRIDAVDRALLKLLVTRIALAKEVGKHKRAHGIRFLDRKRFSELMNARAKVGASLGLSPRFIRELFSVIHAHSLEAEKK